MGEDKSGGAMRTGSSALEDVRRIGIVEVVTRAVSTACMPDITINGPSRMPMGAWGVRQLLSPASVLRKACTDVRVLFTRDSALHELAALRHLRAAKH